MHDTNGIRERNVHTSMFLMLCFLSFWKSDADLCLCRATRRRARNARLSRPGHSLSHGVGPRSPEKARQLMGRGPTDLRSPTMKECNCKRATAKMSMAHQLLRLMKPKRPEKDSQAKSLKWQEKHLGRQSNNIEAVAAAPVELNIRGRLVPKNFHHEICIFSFWTYI